MNLGRTASRFLSHPLSAEEDEVRYTISARLEDFFLSVVAAAMAYADLCNARVVAAVPSVRVVRRRVADVGQVMAIVDATARVNDDGVRFIPERTREGRISGFDTRTCRAIRRRKKVARKVGVVEIPCDGGRRLAQIGGCLLVVEAPEDDTEQGGEAGEREGLQSAGGTSAAVA